MPTKEEAIEFLLYALKKRMNMTKAFMRFHEITEEDIRLSLEHRDNKGNYNGSIITKW